MDTLPPEMLRRIFANLDEIDIFCCYGVCSCWSEIIDFYGTKFSGKIVSRAKIYVDRLKFFDDTEHLKTLHFWPRDTKEITQNCVLRPLGKKLNRLIYDSVTNYDVTLDLANEIRPNLTHLYLNYVLLSKTGFAPMCQNLGKTLQHLYLNVCRDDEKFLDQESLSDGVRHLVNIEHLDLSSLALNSQADQKESIFLKTVAEFCPNLRDLAVSEFFQISSADLNVFFKSENTKNLRFLNLIGSSEVDDTIGEALEYRQDHFKKFTPNLKIFANQTKITDVLSKKYSPFNSEFGLNENDNKSGVIIDTLGIPPYGSLDDYPFMRSTVGDWPASADSEPDEDGSSISGGGHLWHDLQDDFDVGDSDEYDDGGDEGGGADDVYDDYYDDGGDAEFYD